MGGYTIVISGQQLGKHVSATRVTNARMVEQEERCFLWSSPRPLPRNGAVKKISAATNTDITIEEVFSM
jgi:hypothetical protein